VPTLRRARRTGPPLLAATIAGAAAAALLPATAGAVGAPQVREGRASYDVNAAAPAAAPPQPAKRLVRQLGPEGIVEIDPVSGTPRRVGRTDGALTGRSAAAPTSVALGWVRSHRGLFKLDDDDLDALGEPSEVTTPSGIRIVRWRQSYRGIPVTGAELRAHVAADGRLLSVQGGPLTDTSVRSTAPRLSAPGALGAARTDAGERGGVPAVERRDGGAERATTFRDDSSASLVVYPGRGENRLAWHVTAKVDSTHIYSYLIDARDGAVLRRDNMVRFASGYGDAWAYNPSEAVSRNDGHLRVRREFGDDWVFDGSALVGHNAWAYSDVDDDDTPQAGDQVPARTDDGVNPPVWDYEFTKVEAPGCNPLFPCTWNPLVAGSWEDNREQNAVQAFWFVNTFAEHLRRAPIGFDEASGAFRWEVVGSELRGDGVFVETSDGANTGGGLPDDHHINNANMWTPPDGRSPAMQMYLFDGPVDGNGGDDAAIVYHEYTHGLSSRLVTDGPGGTAALFAPQSGAMGEAWSDWYALDFLVGNGTPDEPAYQQDDPATPGEIVLAASLTAGGNGLRESALDCPVDTPRAGNCPRGGFTYADYGKVLSDGPEVHADGEIWAQTLWDLRTALVDRYGLEQGVEAARRLVTDGMRMTPAVPEQADFLDARDAILDADTAFARRTDSAAEQGPDHDLIWQVFARRGMGVYASSDGPYDPSPYANFDATPVAGPPATLTGTVTDADTGAPVAGATVRLPGRDALATTTGSDGRYTLAGVPAGSYPRLLVTRAGYDAPTVLDLDVAPAGSVRDVALRRNWARYDGGAVVLAGVEPAFGDDCAPERLLDGSLAYGWASYAPEWDGIVGDPPELPRYPNGDFPDVEPGPRTIELMLPRKVDITRFLIDPGAICGDDDSASLGEFTIETADDTQQYRMAFDGRMPETRFDRADRANHRLNALTPIAGTADGVRFVRITMYRPQGGPGSSAARFMDLAEFGIHGTTTPEPREPEPRQPEPRQPEPREPEPRQPEPRRPAADTRAPVQIGKTALPKRRSLTALRSRAGLPVRVRFDEAARISATVTLPAATARKLGLTRARRGVYRLARGTLRGTLGARRSGTVRLKLSAAARRRLARTRSLRVTIAITATDAAGNARRVVVKPLLRR